MTAKSAKKTARKVQQTEVSGGNWTDDQKKEFEKMVLNKVRPAALALHFGVAISTVHYQKKLLREAGVIVPSVRGNLPQTSKNGAEQKDKSTPPTNPSGTPNNQNSQKSNVGQPAGSRKSTTTNAGKHINILFINGTPLQIPEGSFVQVEGAKSFTMGENGKFEIIF
ncbi:MAG TPA: hypothetical protein VGM30_10255 [Puia sp.]|jgi:hypothetical protein